MEEPILITWLNDFIFCPVSIYFHNLYGDGNRVAFQDTAQINGTKAHETVDAGSYSHRKNIISGYAVYCEKYNLMGKIDIFDIDRGVLTERKKKIKTIFDGYIYQLYGQCFAMREMGYEVRALELRSLDDNKVYPISLPEDDAERLHGFENVVDGIRKFQLNGFHQPVREKCAHCIYEPLCDSSLLASEVTV